VIQQTALGTEAVFDADLPPALPPTLFARFGSLVPGAMFAMAAAVVLWRQRNT
jgi:apolipoprotein N-acyltransferase